MKYVNATIAAGTLAFCALLSAQGANAADISFTFTNAGVGIVATGTLDVVGGQAISGTGIVTGDGLSGPETLTLVTLSTPGVNNLGGGNLEYTVGGGTDLIGDTAYNISSPPYIDNGGPVFIVGGPGDNGLNFWSNSLTDFGGALAGDHIYSLFYSGGTFSETSPVPEPGSLALLAAGFLGLAGLARFAAFRRSDRCQGAG
jgi:hypothetical protein